MRTALILLLILAVAAIPGSLIPQAGVDALKTSQWQDAHPTLTPIYDKLGMFSVYDSWWFSAIYVLLMVSLVGCIVPRLFVYAKAMRARPPKAPRNLTRMPESASFTTDRSEAEVLDAARVLLKRRRFRTDRHEDSVAAERGYLREAGNLVFHLSILVVLAGFAVGALFGYQGGVIMVVGKGFTNNLTQYDDFNPGGLFKTSQLDPFTFDIDDFDITWLTEGAGAGQARKFVSHLTYTSEPGAEPKRYDLRVNHPLTIGSTSIFLIGHGYAPVITIRDGEGNVTYSGPTVFLPTDTSFRSFGVVKAPDAKPSQIALDGEFYPTVAFTTDRFPFSLFGKDLAPYISMTVWTGDLGMDDGSPQSVYVLDRDKAKPVQGANGAQARVDLALGESQKLPDGLGSVSFDGVEKWNKLQISQTPGKFVALGGVIAALIGLLGSLFIRPRRVWVRTRTENGVTVVEVAALDRSSGGDVSGELQLIQESLGDLARDPREGATTSAEEKA